MGGLVDIRTDIRISVRNYLNKTNPPSFNLHLNQIPGSGKTTIALEECYNNDAFFIYLTNNHNIAGEQLMQHRALFNLLQLESRRRLCKNKEMQDLAKFNINIKHFCPDCPYITVCEYYQRILEIWNEPQSWIGVHHHLGNLANSYADEQEVDVVIIDEYFLSALFKNQRIYYKSLVQTINVTGLMRDCDEKQILIDFLNEFAFALQNRVVNNEQLYAYVYWYYRKGGSDAGLTDFAEEYESRLANMYFNKGKIFRNVITPIVNAIINVFSRYIPMTNPNHLDYICSVFNIVSGEERRFIDIAYYDLEALDLDCKVILLDATTPNAFYQKLFMRKINSISKDLNVTSTIYQLSTAKYVMNTLDTNVNTRKRLLNIVDLIVNKHNQKTLVLSRIKYEKEIQLVNPQLIRTDHYPLVGSNEYEKINVVIAFGTPEPRRDLLERKSILLDYPKEDLLYIMRELYIVQGIHRIRIALKPKIPTYIYLLTSLELPFANIKRMPIGKLERLLKDEVSGYITEENEDRIREDILNLLEEEDMTVTQIKKQVRGMDSIIIEILNRLIKADMVETYKKETSRGRKPILCRLTT